MPTCRRGTGGLAPRLVVFDRAPVNEALQAGEGRALALAPATCLGLDPIQVQRVVPGVRQTQQQLLAIPDLWPLALGVVEQLAHGAGVGDGVTGAGCRHQVSVAPIKVGVAPGFSGKGRRTIVSTSP